MNFISFDIEIAKEVEGTDWNSQRPLGISCAATQLTNSRPMFWFDCDRSLPVFSDDNSNLFTRFGPQLTREKCYRLVRYLKKCRHNGYLPLTWNGISFDFDILAEESGMHQECAELALDHVDMMFQLVCMQGYPVGLDTCLKAQGFQGKQGMTGANAPRTWKTDPDAVLRYVAGDASGQLELAHFVENQNIMRWTSKRGISKHIYIRRWLTVRECLELPLPDTSWMTEPRSSEVAAGRESYYAWTQRVPERV